MSYLVSATRHPPPGGRINKNKSFQEEANTPEA